MRGPQPAGPCLLLATMLALASCDSDRSVEVGPVGTPELRAALLDTILARTMRRESFSPVKERRLGISAIEDMRSFGPEVVGSDGDEALYYALAKLSNARRDSHLELFLVPGGIALPDPAGVTVSGVDEGDEPPVFHAPVRVLPDYGSVDDTRYFVSDVSLDEAHYSGPPPVPGDRVVAVNQWTVEEYIRYAAPYHRASTDANLRWRIAEALPQRTAALPAVLRRERLGLTLRGRDGSTYEVSLPYLHPDSIEWGELAEASYPGFRPVGSTPTYDLFLPAGDAPVVLLRWYGFRETMVDDVDALVARASAEGWLGRDLIIDATRSRGGSAGAYALQRFTPRSFKTTFGNLRLSDVVPVFLQQKRAEVTGGGALDSGVPETIDDGTWLMEWLETDVSAAMAAGASYSNDVPFKLAHAPKDSDGVLTPAPVHFSGRLVVFLGPRRGSHLDQFAAIIADNGLGWTIGMPAGGYSNTWEWEEVLTYPGTDQPVIGFMWSIGHTLRPTGEILEGNPADVDEWVPLTADNFLTYYADLVARALAYLGHG